MFESDERRQRVLEQMKKVRDSGRINMMDASGVQRVAYDRDMHALVGHLGSRPAKNYHKLLEEFEEWLKNNEDA